MGSQATDATVESKGLEADLSPAAAGDGQMITEDEAALYDRQIRLWGLDAQKRLRAARVLLVHVGGLGAEVAKNLILAGVKSLTMLDSATVTRAEASCQFFIPTTKLGENRAEASVERAQRLNPMVEVKALSLPSTDLAENDLNCYDVVVATCLPSSEMVRLDNICRKKGKLFFAGDVYGFFGFMFSDLGKHQYAEEVQVPDHPAASGEPAAKRARTEAPATRTVKRSVDFCSLKEALDVTWKSEQKQKLLRRFSSTYFVIRVLQQFRAVHARRPLPSSAEKDAEQLTSIAGEVAAQLHVPEEKIGTEFTALCLGELSAVCAVVGGVLAQEVIKAVSQKDKPLLNFFLFNGDISEGVVEHLAA